jgi:ethanolamine utilization protein EutN
LCYAAAGMYLGKVIGTVVATRRVAGLEGRKLLAVEPLDERGQPNGSPAEVAVDVSQAGPGEVVFLVGSREAALAVEPTFVPVDAAILGIVDHLPGKP